MAKIYRGLKIFILLLPIFVTQVILIKPAFADTYYNYDANGNLTSDGQYCYDYNEANQLKTIKSCSNMQLVAEYIYDYDGNRIRQKEYQNGTLKQTIYSPDKEYETKKIASNGATQNTVYYKANNEIVARKNPDGTKNYYINDLIGSNAVIMNQAGNVLERTIYAPFGEVRTGGTISKYQFTGQEKDFESNLSYFNSRYYNPHTFHFTQPDTMLPDVYDPQQLNRYSYARNNPIKYTDSSGHFIDELLDAAFIALDVNDIKSQPTNLWNWAALGVDVAGAAIPGLTGGRIAVKALEHTSVRLVAEAVSMSSKYNHIRDAASVIEKGGDSAKYLTEIPEIGWKLGDPINNKTIRETEPAWTTVRQRFWKTEASELGNVASWNWSMEDVGRMQQGLAPQRFNSQGVIESLELNHVPPQREGGLYNFNIVTHEQHSLVDPFRY